MGQIQPLVLIQCTGKVQCVPSGHMEEEGEHSSPYLSPQGKGSIAWPCGGKEARPIPNPDAEEQAWSSPTGGRVYSPALNSHAGHGVWVFGRVGRVAILTATAHLTLNFLTQGEPRVLDSKTWRLSRSEVKHP